MWDQFCLPLHWCRSGYAHWWTQSHSRFISVQLKGKSGPQLLYMDTKWKPTTAFLSLTLLHFVGYSETTRIATTHSKKKKESKHITRTKLLFWDTSLCRLSVQTNSSVPKFDLRVNSVGGIQVVRKHNLFFVVVVGERVDKILPKKTKHSPLMLIFSVSP